MAGMRGWSAVHCHTSLESYDVAVRPLGGVTLQACSSAREKEKLPSPTTSVDMPQRSRDARGCVSTKLARARHALKKLRVVDASVCPASTALAGQSTLTTCHELAMVSGGRVGGNGIRLAPVMSAMVAAIAVVSIPTAGSHAITTFSSSRSFLPLSLQRQGVPRLLRLAGGSPFAPTTGPVQSPPTKKTGIPPTRPPRHSPTHPPCSTPSGIHAVLHTSYAAGQEQGDGTGVRARLGKLRATIGTWVSANVARVRRIRLTRQQAAACAAASVGLAACVFFRGSRHHPPPASYSWRNRRGVCACACAYVRAYQVCLSSLDVCASASARARDST